MLIAILIMAMAVYFKQTSTVAGHDKATAIEPTPSMSIAYSGSRAIPVTVDHTSPTITIS